MESKTEYTAIIVDDENIHKREKNKCYCICLSVLITFALCFFLIPRNPDINLETIYLSVNNSGYSNFKFTNNNFYQEKWSNPDLILYWIPYDGQVVGEKCYNNNNVCNKYIDNQCAIKLGEFKNSNHYTINAKTSKKHKINLLTSSNQEKACTTWMILNPYENLNQLLVTEGKIKVKNMMMKSKNKQITNQYYYF